MQKRCSHSVLLLALALNLAVLARADDASTLPTVTTVGSDANLSENDPVGPYGQPDWTTQRRFPTTRVYLQQQPWEVGFEQWWRARTFGDEPAAHRFQEELEIGLPYRFQLDLYYTWTHEDRKTRFDEASVELRYALADWGKIWGNPTLYLEYAFANHDYNGDTLESKILFGDDIGKRIHWGLNFSFESELSHELSKEFVVAGGVSYTIVDELLSAGVEMQFTHETVAGERSDPSKEFEIGPSVQWRISRNAHLDLVALFGCTSDGPRFESFVVLGWDFGTVGGEHHYAPAAVHQ